MKKNALIRGTRKKDGRSFSLFKLLAIVEGFDAEIKCSEKRARKALIIIKQNRSVKKISI